MPINYSTLQTDTGSNTKNKPKYSAYKYFNPQPVRPPITPKIPLSQNRPATSKKPRYNPSPRPQPVYGSPEWAKMNYGANYYKPSWKPDNYVDRYDRMNKSQLFENINSGFWGANPEFDFDDATKAALGLEVYDPNWIEDFYAYFGGQDAAESDTGYYVPQFEYPSWGGGSYGSAKPGYKGMNDVYWRI